MKNKILSNVFSLTNLFYATVFIYLVIVLIPYAFVTHDGPSHLYNSHIINELLFSDTSIYQKFHAFNPDWAQPNLSGYIILCLLQLIVPFLMAEKIMIALYVLIFSFGFKFYLKQITIYSDWYCLLVFPFLLNAVLFLGFYNFLIGLALSFWLIGLFEKYKKNLTGFRIIQLLFLSLLIYYSHALVFILCGLYVAIQIIIEWINGGNRNKYTLIIYFKSILVFIPGVFLFIIYLIQQKSAQIEYGKTYSALNRLSQLWFEMGSINFTGYSERNYTKIFYIILIILAVIKLYQDFVKKKNIFNVTFIVFLSYILLFLFIPDNAAGGGIITLRLNLMFFLFWIVWVSDVSLTKFTKVLILICYLINIALLNLRWSVIECGAIQCKAIIESTDSIVKPNTVISSIHYKPVRGFIGEYQIHSYIDFMSNLDNYVAIKHNLVTLHNYEAGNSSFASYFPVIWKEHKNAEYIWQPIGSGEILEYFKLSEFENKWNHTPAMILSLGSFEKKEKFKPLWDSKNKYSLLKADSVSFLNVYSLKEIKN